MTTMLWGTRVSNCTELISPIQLTSRNSMVSVKRQHPAQVQILYSLHFRQNNLVHIGKMRTISYFKRKHQEIQFYLNFAKRSDFHTSIKEVQDLLLQLFLRKYHCSRT